MIITLTGPSLTGKSTLARKLETLGCEELISFTTRPMREGEIQGKTYWFLSHEKINEYQKNGELLELIPLGNQLYGLSKEELERVMSQNKVAVLVVAPEGLTQVRDYCQEHNIDIYSAFVNNDKDILVKRFLERFKNDSLADINNYVKRFMQFDTEYIEWTKPALDGQMYYDAIFPNFDNDTAQEVLDKIWDDAQKKFFPSKKLKL